MGYGQKAVTGQRIVAIVGKFKGRISLRTGESRLAPMYTENSILPDRPQCTCALCGSDYTSARMDLAQSPEERNQEAHPRMGQCTEAQLRSVNLGSCKEPSSKHESS